MTPGSAENGGIFLSLKELAAIFPRFKKNEGALAAEERQVLSRMEKFLYQNISIAEIEALERETLKMEALETETPGDSK